VPVFNSLQEEPSEYSFLPPKGVNNLVFYASENFYVFLRFFYALYERIIRMKEVSQDDRKVQIFQILYFACIKTKESTRFEDCLNALFGEHAYLFTTFYKLLESLQKTLNHVSLCQLYNYSLKYMES
jgi:histone deacetylase complex regulatory component SIN3